MAQGSILEAHHTSDRTKRRTGERQTDFCLQGSLKTRATQIFYSKMGKFMKKNGMTYSVENFR